MPQFRILAIWGPPSFVIESALRAAHDLGMRVDRVDRQAGDIFLRSPGTGRRAYAVAITDNGVGGSVVHISWTDADPVSRMMLTDYRIAGRFLNALKREAV